MLRVFVLVFLVIESIDVASADNSTVAAKGIPQSESAPDYFQELATLAFQEGRERDALKYLYAHGLTSDQGADEVIRSIRWVPGLRRPALAVRWGVGVEVKAPEDLANNLFPIGSVQTAAAQRGRAGNTGAGGKTGLPLPKAKKGEEKSNAVKSLEQVAGDLGDRVLKGYHARLETGSFGASLKLAAGDLAKTDDLVKASKSRVSKDRRSDDNLTISEREFIYGEKIVVTEQSLSEQYKKAGGNDPRLASREKSKGPPESPKTPSSPEATKPAKKVPSADRRTMNLLDVGAMYLGSGKQHDLIAKAKSEDLDLLLLFEVSVKRPPRGNGPIVNETKMVLLDVKTATPAFSSKLLTNVAVQQAREQNRDDGVDKEVERLLTAVNGSYSVTDLPASISAERALARVKSLSTSKPEDPLPVLGEIKLYHLLGFIRDPDLIQAFDGLIGAGQGKTLAHGSFEDRRSIIQRMLPK
jgi:hypothetical protein